ncbi:terpenoid synthase [Thozetella sp. PMI_491]|nr:terpenoid synthase [Thozetella sp. PMI_491]
MASLHRSPITSETLSLNRRDPYPAVLFTMAPPSSDVPRSPHNQIPAMTYQYSSPIDPSIFDTQGLCNGLPLRCHNNPELEQAGVSKAQQDWVEHVGPLDPNTRSPPANNSAISMAYPEALPDRLEILGYFHEFLFIHDSILGANGVTPSGGHYDELQEAFRSRHASSPVGASRGNGRNWMVRKVASEMLGTDPFSASAALGLWDQWIGQETGLVNYALFDRLDDYLDYRANEVGRLYLTGVAVFAMGLTVPASEMATFWQLSQPAWRAVALTNDLTASTTLGAPYQRGAGAGPISNAIGLVMRTHSMMETEAREYCHQQLRENITYYMATVEHTKRRTDISADLRTLVESVMFIISGNIIWNR